jgi:hypothetical protein
MRTKRGAFHLDEDGKYYVHYRDPQVGEGVEKFVLSEDDQQDRKLYLKESMSMEGEEVEFEIRKRFLAGKTEYFAKLMSPEETYTLEDLLEAAKYGYEYRENTAHPDEPLPTGNVLQWLMARKQMTNIPLTWQKYKQS